MSPDVTTADAMADLLAELLTAAHHGTPEELSDSVLRLVAETRANPGVGQAVVVGLVSLAHDTVEDWCATLDGGDWAATIARIRRRLQEGPRER